MACDLLVCTLLGLRTRRCGTTALQQRATTIEDLVPLRPWSTAGTKPPPRQCKPPGFRPAPGPCSARGQARLGPDRFVEFDRVARRVLDHDLLGPDPGDDARAEPDALVAQGGGSGGDVWDL